MIAEESPLRRRVADSYTEGEPSRVVVDGWTLRTGAELAARRAAGRRALLRQGRRCNILEENLIRLRWLWDGLAD